MDYSDMATASAGQTARAIRCKEISPTEAVGAAIDRIERLNPHLNAFVYCAFDEARAVAAQADDLVASGIQDLPPLLGVPSAIKDLFDFVPGWPATFGGIPALHDFSPPATCLWAERMQAAGAILLGKTNSPVLGFRGTCDNPLFGATGNPFDPARNSGGSSGGAAAAVASGMLPIAEATDGGGSIRIPASWCGVVGMKSSWGRVPVVTRPNAFGGINPFVCEGAVARTTEDLALALAVVSGLHPGDPLARGDAFTVEGALPRMARGVSGLRIAYSPDLGGFPVEPGVRGVVEAALSAFEEAGGSVELVETRLPRDSQELARGWCRLISARNYQAVLSLRNAGFDGMGRDADQLPPALRDYLAEAARMTVQEFEALQVMRTEVYDFVQSFFTGRQGTSDGSAGFDLLVCPTTAATAVPNGPRGETVGPLQVNGAEVDPYIGWCLTFPMNFSGHPAASVPAGMLAGLPVGLQVIGPLGADADVLAAAWAVEQVRPWAHTYSETELSRAHMRRE
ncbi:MAG: amidase [Micrococcales bacterium]|nr:amidase [Micrococcales bacterium]